MKKIIFALVLMTSCVGSPVQNDSTNVDTVDSVEVDSIEVDTVEVDSINFSD